MNLDEIIEVKFEGSYILNLGSDLIVFGFDLELKSKLNGFCDRNLLSGKTNLKLRVIVIRFA